jgi:hypothetical protein
MSVVSKATLAEKFALVFRENRWGNAESVSGAGSALSSPSVLECVQVLDELIRRLKIRSINDVPCGDFYWIPLILGRFPSIEYKGFDIVSELIEWNRHRFPDYNFQALDATEGVMPQADMIFCKDLFLHLPHYAIAQALRNFKLSGSRFMLVTSVAAATNEELVLPEPGAFRHVNLSGPPFSLPAPMWATNYLSLWSLDALPMRVFDDLCARFPVP